MPLKFVKKSDKSCIRLHVHQIDMEDQFWAYIDEIAINAYEEGLRVRKKNRIIPDKDLKKMKIIKYGE